MPHRPLSGSASQVSLQTHLLLMAPNLLHKNDQEHPIYQPPLPAVDSAFPILVIAVLSIIGTAFLLLTYYIFVIKCCSNWHHIDHLLRRFSLWRARRNEDPFIALSPTMWNHHGLDQSVIRQIPTFQFKRREAVEGSIYGCVVCLNEFHEQDMLRVLPNCSHAFHLDCIDVWLQSNANCPLCRSSISGTTRYPFDQIIAPSSSPQNSHPYTDSLMGGDEDFVVIELGGQDDGVLLPHRQRERDDDSRELSSSVQPRSCQSPRKLEKKHEKSNSKPRKRNHVSIMGDESIDVREKDDQFFIQPIRRSFSLDSATDRQLYLTVQAVIQQNRQISTAQECERRVQRSLHSFRHGQGSRNAVFPIQ